MIYIFFATLPRERELWFIEVVEILDYKMSQNSKSFLFLIKTRFLNSKPI